MTDHATELRTKIAEITDRGKIDGIDPINAILVICDMRDTDPVQVMRDVALEMNKHFTERQVGTIAALIHDLLEISQSNLERSVEDITEILVLNAQIEEIEREI